MVTSFYDITVMSTPFKEFPLQGIGAVEKVAFQRALALHNMGLKVNLISPMRDEISLSLPVSRIKKINLKTPPNKSSPLAFLLTSRSLSYFLPYLKLERHMYGEVVINDGLRLDPWDFLLISHKLRYAKVINILHSPGPSFGSVKMRFLSPIYKRGIYGALSKNMCKYLSSLGYIVHYFPNGIDIPNESEVNIYPQDYFISMGRIEPSKGVHLAIRLARKLKRKLIILGKIYDSGYFVQKVKPYLDSSSVTFLGQVDYQTLFKLLSNAAALLYFGERYDPLPTVLLESISYGVPVIGWNPSEMSGLYDIIRNEVNGIILNENSEHIDVERKLDEIDRREVYQNAKESWSWEAVLNKYQLPVIRNLFSS